MSQDRFEAAMALALEAINAAHKLAVSVPERKRVESLQKQWLELRKPKGKEQGR